MAAAAIQARFPIQLCQSTVQSMVVAMWIMLALGKVGNVLGAERMTAGGEVMTFCLEVPLAKDSNLLVNKNSPANPTIPTVLPLCPQTAISRTRFWTWQFKRTHWSHNTYHLVWRDLSAFTNIHWCMTLRHIHSFGRCVDIIKISGQSSTRSWHEGSSRGPRCQTNCNKKCDFHLK